VLMIPARELVLFLAQLLLVRREPLQLRDDLLVVAAVCAGELRELGFLLDQLPLPAACFSALFAGGLSAGNGPGIARRRQF
jgi:hypothetical protein